MADPVVILTNGVPTSGNGQVTTLGQTLLDGANVTHGATTDAAVAAGAAGTFSAKLRAISRDIAALATGLVLGAGTAIIGKVGIDPAANGISATSLPLPTGAATATLQSTANTSLTQLHTDLTSLIADLVSETTAQATSAKQDVQTTALNLLHTDLGGIGIDPAKASQAFGAAVTVTRPANTTAYVANDVVGATAAAITFPNMGPSGGRIMITTAQLEIDDTAILSGETSYRLYLYGITPPSALADNALFDLPAGDRASFLGYIDLGTPADLGSTLYVETSNINKQLLLTGTSLFGYLVTNGPYTPESGRVCKITLNAVAV